MTPQNQDLQLGLLNELTSHLSLITISITNQLDSPVSELVVGPEPVDATPQEEAPHPDTETLAVHHAPSLYGQLPQYLAPGESRAYQSCPATGAQGSLHQLQGSQAE